MNVTFRRNNQSKGKNKNNFKTNKPFVSLKKYLLIIYNNHETLRLKETDIMPRYTN